MNDYDVTLTFDQFVIITCVYADDEDMAERFALQKLQEEGLNLYGWKYEPTIEKRGEFVR
jgi:hypothetical protein